MPGHPRSHPGADRPKGQSPAPRQSRWQTTAFDPELYKARNVVERCLSRLKQFRAIATRFDKPATRYRAGLHIASLILWRRQPAHERLPDRA